jgi:hypothetical protein
MRFSTAKFSHSDSLSQYQIARRAGEIYLYNPSPFLAKERTMNDNYGKAVFTVIALALSVIAWNQTYSPAQALGDERLCTSFEPCHIVVENWP